MTENWEGYRLTLNNIRLYLRSRYNAIDLVKTDYYELENFPYLDQNDYGLKEDCSITSMTASIGYLFTDSKNYNTIYSDIENIGKKYFYNGKIGVLPFFIKSIYSEICFKYKLHREKTIRSKYLIDIGFNLKEIKQALLNKYPVILNL